MDVLTRENGVIAGSIVVAIVAWYAVESFTDLGDAAAYAALIGVGVILPTIFLHYTS